MSFINEQQEQEYIQELLSKHGIPNQGSIHVIHEGDEDNFVTEEIDDLFHPESTVIHLVPKGGDWMDGQGYDKEGYKVYND